jgi:glutamate dehydrogenase/leucine dehydrogenase
VLTAAEIKDNPAALDVYTSHQNMRATLVDAYKQQTGQVPAQLTGKATAATTATSTASLTTAKANTVKATTTKTQTTTTTTNTQTKK